MEKQPRYPSGIEYMQTAESIHRTKIGNVTNLVGSERFECTIPVFTRKEEAIYLFSYAVAMLAGGVIGWKVGEGISSLMPWESFSNSVAMSIVLGYTGFFLGAVPVAGIIEDKKFRQPAPNLQEAI